MLRSSLLCRPNNVVLLVQSLKLQINNMQHIKHLGNKLLLTCLVQLLCICCFAYSSELKGSVHTAQGPLASANIVVVGTEYATFTDSDGEFIINTIPPGQYRLLVSHVGYQTSSDTITVPRNGEAYMRIVLQEDALNSTAVVVSGTRYKQDRVNNPVVVGIVDSKQLDATQSIAISEGLNYQPGVRVETNCQNCGFTQVRINGLEGAYSQILINSRPVFSALNSVYGLDQIPSSIVERIEIVRGGGSALYGSNAIAGIVNITTKEPNKNSWEIRSSIGQVGGGSPDLTHSFNSSFVPDDQRHGVTFFGMHRDRGGYDANGDEFTELVEMQNTVVGGKAFLKPTDRSKVTIDFSSIDEYRRGGNALDRAPHFADIAEQLNHRTVFAGSTYDLFSVDYQNHLGLYASTQHTNRKSYYGGLGGGRTLEDSLVAQNAYGNTDDIASITGAQYTTYFSQDVLTIGVEHQISITEDNIPGYERNVDQKVSTSGLFAQFEWKPSEVFTALIGGRIDHSVVDGVYTLGSIKRRVDIRATAFSPRISLLYHLSEAWRLRGGFATGFRNPQAFNEDLHISSVGGEPSFVVLSNEVSRETSNAYSASINYTTNYGSQQISGLLEGFYTELHNPFAQVSMGEVLSTGHMLEEVRNGEGAHVFGGSLEVGYSPSSALVLLAGGTLQQSQYDSPQVLFESTTQERRNVFVHDFVRTPSVYGFFSSSIQVTSQLSADFTGTFTGSMTVPRVIGPDGYLELVETEPFLEMNVLVRYVFSLDSGMQAEISGGVKNLWNSYQSDFDSGPERDSDYVYGPMLPRSMYVSVSIGSQ